MINNYVCTKLKKTFLAQLLEFFFSSRYFELLSNSNSRLFEVFQQSRQLRIIESRLYFICVVY